MSQLRWLCLTAIAVAALRSPVTAQVAPGSLEGKVMAIGRQPLWGARVYLVGASTSVVTDSSGHYRFPAVPAGVITVQAMELGSKSVAVAGVQIRPGELTSQDIILSPAPVSDNGLNRTSGTRPEVTYVDALPDSRQPPPASPGRLEGTIRDAANRGVANALVMVTGTMESARTDSAGRYLLSMVPSGTLTVRVTRDGYADAQAEGLRLRRGETVLQDFQLILRSPQRP